MAAKTVPWTYLAPSRPWSSEGWFSSRFAFSSAKIASMNSSTRAADSATSFSMPTS
jgi:hypothetical protein